MRTDSSVIDPLSELFPIRSESPDQTRESGRRLAAALALPWTIALYGSLGAGKTQFVKGLADGLGLSGDEVTSPTFTIAHEYRSASRCLIHIDAYRISSPLELERLGMEEYLYGDCPCVVEWPERLEHLLPTDTIRLRLEHLLPTDTLRLRLEHGVQSPDEKSTAHADDTDGAEASSVPSGLEGAQITASRLISVVATGHG